MKTQPLNTATLNETIASFKQKLDEAIRLSSPGDIASITRLSVGVNALTKAFGVLEKTKEEVEEIDIDDFDDFD